MDSRTALIEHFRDHATVMIATEAASEGVNLQFCSLVVNYDLPWNPQRIEQRIGRCHRYGQKYDVVVINFLNERNEADRRVHELLSEKFSLFNGVFGASDEVLGTIESGVDFERRVLAIYQQCRSTEQIDIAFRQLQHEMEESIQSRMDDTRKVLIEQFDEDVHGRLKMRLSDARTNLDRIGRLYWTLTRFILADHAAFDDSALSFVLDRPPLPTCKPGRYNLISKSQPNVPGEFLYRLSHPLGEWVIDTGKTCPAPVATVRFDVSRYPVKLSMVEAIKGQSGWLGLQHLSIDTFDKEEFLLFSAFSDLGKSLDQETCERLFHCSGTAGPLDGVPDEAKARLMAEAGLNARGRLRRVHVHLVESDAGAGDCSTPEGVFVGFTEISLPKVTSEQRCSTPEGVFVGFTPRSEPTTRDPGAAQRPRASSSGSPFMSTPHPSRDRSAQRPRASSSGSRSKLSRALNFH